MKRASSCHSPPLTQRPLTSSRFLWQLPMLLEKIDSVAISFLGDDLYDPMPLHSVFKDGNKFT